MNADGMAWIEQLAELWEGGAFDRCAADHGEHETMAVPTPMFGTLEVFSWPTYEHTTGFCEGDDEVSKSLDINGFWEPFGWALARDVLDQSVGGDPYVVLDFGSHIGTYALLAARVGYPTLAIDASTEHLRVLAANAERMGVSARIAQCRGWIGPDSAVCPLPPDGVRVRLLKSDLEGAEDEVLRVARPLFAERLVDNALVEVSPIFADHYIDTVAEIMDYGYSCEFVITMKDEEVEPIDRDRLDVQLDVDQRDVMFRLLEDE